MHQVLSPRVVLSSVTDKVDALLIHGQRIYIGASSGRISVYLVHEDSEDEATLECSSEEICKKAVEQLGIIKETNSLVILSDGVVTLADLHTLALQMVLKQTKSQANIFEVDSSIQSQASSANSGTPGIPSVLTTLAVGCKRRCIFFSWRDSEWQPPKEIALPHQIRSLTFPKPDTLILGFSTSSYGRVILPAKSNMQSKPVLEDFVLPSMDSVQSPTSSSASPAVAPPEKSIPGFSSLGLGNLTLGLGGIGRVAKNEVLSTGKGELLVMRDNIALLISSNGKSPTTRSIVYPIAPDEIIISPPYIVSLIPQPQAQGTSQTKHTHVSTQVQLHSISTLSLIQSFPLPPEDSIAPTSSADHRSAPQTQSVRLLTSSTGNKPPLAAVLSSATSPSSICLLTMLNWPAQIDQMTSNGSYTEALSLLESVEDLFLPDKPNQRQKLQGLVGVQQFFKGKYDEAIDAFIALDTNPAKVVSLYEKEVSGKLYREPDKREEVFGGRTEEVVKSQKEEAEAETPTTAGHWRFGSIRGKKEDDTASIRSTTSRKPHARQNSVASSVEKTEDASDPKRAVEVLLRYLTDRRQKVNKALTNLRSSVRPTPSMSIGPASAEELLALPDGSMTKLTPQELHRVAQIVDTALFKCYLAIRPSLLGSLCRLDNWCEVEEVEELLTNAKRFRELLDLYNGKNDHEKALKLLKRMSEEEEDVHDKIDPTVQYLHKLGPAHLELIFEASEWVFDISLEAGLDIFIADIEEVESLPRHAVALHLEHLDKIGSQVCQVYLEHIIHVLHEDGPEFHEKLIELYLEDVKHGDPDDAEEMYSKLLDFLETSTQYRPDRLLGRLPADSMFEARALLLGRLGQHEGALQIYVNRLKDYETAEEYCRRTYDQSPDERGSIFLTLLYIYLRPKTSSEPLFDPALQLLARQGGRIDASEVLDLLPPLITVQSLDHFLTKALRKQVQTSRGLKVEREIYRARMDQLQRGQVVLESKHVKITDRRLCPVCHKRLGNSVIAVHQPHGTVTHYRCKENYHT